MPWMCRMSYRHCTHPVQSSMHFWERNFRLEGSSHTGKKDRRKLPSALTIPCHRRIRYVKNTAILQGNILSARPVARKQKFTAGSPDIIVRYRTGTTEKRRNIKTEPCTISLHYGAPAAKPVEAEKKEEQPAVGGKHATRTMVTMTKDDVKIQHPDTVKYLFTTSTCPNCKIAKKMLAGGGRRVSADRC